MESNEKMQEAMTDAIFDSMKIMAKLDAKHPGTDAIIAAHILVSLLEKYKNIGPAGDLVLGEVYKVLSTVEIK